MLIFFCAMRCAKCKREIDILPCKFCGSDQAEEVAKYGGTGGGRPSDD